MYLLKNSGLIQKTYPSLTWKVKTNRKEIYLTFDDGPHPTITPWVLETLARYNAKATFFCVGKNAKEHPEVYKQILDAGHSTGNHTYDHINGWKSSTNQYMSSVKNCGNVFGSSLFRPPYGKIKRSQIKKIKANYEIIMWTLLSGDFDDNMMPDECLNRMVPETKGGSIVVFHDSEKAEERLRYILPRYLNHFSQIGWEFKKL